MAEDNEASRIVLDEARDAWNFQASGMGWQKWLAVGRGLQECQRQALEHAHSNDFKSHAARKAMANILEAERLDRIDKGDRSVLLTVMAQLPAITAWRDTLTTTERVRYNHPRTVMARLEKATTVPPPAPDNGEAAAPRGYKKASFQRAETEISELKQRLKTEGSLFNLETDTVEQIAKAVVGNVLASRAERIANAVLKLLRERKQSGHAG